MRVLILSTVHRWNDPRIFHKQARTLAREHEVTLAAVGEGPEQTVDNVRVILLGTWRKQSDRPRLWVRAYREIFRLKSDVIHFHDPELALILLPLPLISNKRFVCDVHEHPSGGYGKRPWIPKFLKKWIGGFFYRLLKSTPYLYDAVLLAEDSYLAHFPKKNNVHLMHNYALLPSPETKYFDRYAEFNPREELRLIYVGCLMEYRGAFEMVDMVEKLAERYPGVSLDLIGRGQPPSIEAKLQREAEKLNGKVRLHGYIDWKNVEPFLKKAHLGLIPLKPDPNLVGSLATKFFDYMIYGLPFVASDFPLWRNFIEENPAGVNADASDPDQFVDAIISLVESPERLRELSRNGYRLVRKKFLWENEGQRLLQIYRNFSF